MVPKRRILRLPTLALALVLAVTLQSCLRLSMRRERVGEPIPAARFAALAVGQDSLADVLGELGAPLRVFPLVGGRIGLAYGWSDRFGIDGSASFNFNEFTPSVSASIGNDQLDIEGWVLFFSRDDTLERLQRGSLGALIPGPRDRDLPIPR